MLPAGVDVDPLATAIVPSFNYARFVVRAVESCLAQSFPSFEVVVVDDASTDGSQDLLRQRFAEDPRVRLELFRENLGVSGNFNRGLRAARGRYVGFCGADDEWLPHHLATLVPVLEATPAAVLAYARPRVVSAEGAPVPPGPGCSFSGCEDAFFFERLVRAPNQVPFVATVFRREEALTEGGFREDLSVLQDYALWIRLSARREVRYVNRENVVVRWHGANASANDGRPGRSEQIKRDAVRVFADLLERERPLLRDRGLERVARHRLADSLRRLSSRTRSRDEARACARRAIALEPFSLGAYVRYLRALARPRDESTARR